MEDKQLRDLLEENLTVAKENARELKRIRKELLWMSVLRIVVWLILAGVPIFLYLHFVKPSFEELFGPYTSTFEQ